MINVLQVVSQNVTGLQYHRQLVPHSNLITKHKDEFNLFNCYDINNVSDEQLKDIQIVQFLRTVSTTGKTNEVLQRVKDAGCKTILDIDDYWNLDKTHLMYEAYQKHEIPKQTEDAVKGVDWVTTTTGYFADIIKEFNTNVTVLPNAIDPVQEQFKPFEIKSPRLRFGYVGGVYHEQDVELLRPSAKKLFEDNTVRDKWQICLAGFGANPTYIELERKLTNDYHSLRFDKDYLSYLFRYTNAAEHVGFNKPYRRIWGKSVFEYGYVYNEIDVALVPLVETKFNACKSELKIIESAFMGKAVIVSDVMPYKHLLKDGYNCIAVKPSRNGIDWFTAMRRLINNPDMVEDLREGLKETICTRFHIDTVTETRRDLYKRLVE